jgi:preprotein translocase subunit SecD
VPKNLRRKWILICVVVLACVVGTIGLPRSRQELADNWKRNIRLGLDLKGGSHIVLQIQVQDAFKAEADVVIDRLQERFASERLQYRAIDRNEPDSIETADTIAIDIRGVPTGKANDLRLLVNEVAGQPWNLTSSGPEDYRLTLRPDAASRLRQDTLTQSMSTIQRKVDALGLAEVSVQQRGGSGADAEILVQLPGVDDPVRVKGILQTAAILGLYEVIDGPYSSQQEALGKRGGVLPSNAKFVRESAAGMTGPANWWIVARSPVVTGRDLRDARAQQGDLPGSWDTGFALRSGAAERFGRFTEANVGRRLAIVLDNVVLSAPRIDTRISDQGRITGAATAQEAADLALNLRSGALPASLKVTEERTVGPSLGADSIRKGVVAGVVGLMLVVASMLLYYRGAGLNSVLALLLNTIMTVAALSYLDATWTLPGIAGLILSIGMAVDSNVLIFERIKEETRGGKSVALAISSGFGRAFTTIVDTHVTTIVASAFLFVFGTGPVRGFAVTLVIGLIANLFTAVFVSRAIFDIHLWRNPKLENLSIGQELFKPTQIDFLSKRTLTLGMSVVAVLISIGGLVVMGGPKYGLDFRGGTLMYVKFSPAPPIDELRSVLSAGLKRDFSLQETQGGELIIGTGLADEESLEQARLSVEQTLRDRYANLGGKLDLNNTSAVALADRLRNALPRAGVSLDEQGLKSLVSGILDYRDREKGGLIGSLDELAKVPGVGQEVLQALSQEAGLGGFNLRSVEIVGPRAGEQLRRQGLYATLGALGGMLIYIAYRFKFITGAVAVIATIHDVLITLGLFLLTNREIDLTIVAALLTLIGYSMNDKIVVFDRVRENERGLSRARRGASSFLGLVNQSINQTLSRTLLTAGPTLLACLALYFLGGPVLNGIAFALFTGIVVGTYSSIFVASALLVMWRERQPALASGKA